MYKQIGRIFLNSKKSWVGRDTWENVDDKEKGKEKITTHSSNKEKVVFSLKKSVLWSLHSFIGVKPIQPNLIRKRIFYVFKLGHKAAKTNLVIG